MALTDKLRNLDQKLLPGTRGDEEDAESYLRRVAAGRAISPAQAGDVMAALRQYLGVQEGETADQPADGDEDSDEQQSDEPTDEASDESEDDSSTDESDDSDE